MRSNPSQQLWPNYNILCCKLGTHKLTTQSNMFRTVNSVRMLQAIAMIATLAVLLWSLGLPSLRFVEAANITEVSDTLSDSAPSASSTHTIVFTSPSGVPNGATTTISFPGFTVGAVDFTDIDVNDGTERTLAADCTGADPMSASFTGTSLELVYCDGNGGSLAAGGTTTIEIGTNATTGATGDRDLVNPGSEGSVRLSFDLDSSTDTGSTIVAIINSVLVTAAVDTIFTFKVSGTAAGTSVNGDTTTGLTTTTTIPFGTMSAGSGNATTSAQRLTVNTNASNGYVVTVQVDGDLQSATGAVIDSFIDGSATNTPTTWVSPAGTLNQLNTYGHWGITSDDATTTRAAADEFDASEYIGASTTPVVVMSHSGPANGAGVGVGTTTVGYKIEITALQEAADDYTATLTYVATPTF